MNNKMLALYGLKWNPFTPNVPTEALHVTTRLESFCWRVQQLAGDGGFALVTGVPGCGKSAALRILTASLATQRDVMVGVISRPQANIADFYREMGDLFGVELRPHNRWGGAKILRQRWQAHIQSTLSRPVLLVDEAQDMQPVVLAVLRRRASADLDPHILLTSVLASDGRLADLQDLPHGMRATAGPCAAGAGNCQHHFLKSLPGGRHPSAEAMPSTMNGRSLAQSRRRIAIPDATAGTSHMRGSVAILSIYNNLLNCCLCRG